MKRQIDIDNVLVHRVGSVKEWQDKVQASHQVEPAPKVGSHRRVLGSIRDVVGAKRSPTMSEAFA